MWWKSTVEVWYKLNASWLILDLESLAICRPELGALSLQRNICPRQLEDSKAGAEGVVGADLHEGSHNWSPHVIEFFAIGTAVLPIAGHAPEDIPDPQLVLSVNS